MASNEKKQNMGSPKENNQVDNSMEYKHIFNLFQPNQNGEIEIKHINNLLRQFDNLKLNFHQQNQDNQDQIQEKDYIKQSQAVQDIKQQSNQKSKNLQQGQNRQQKQGQVNSQQDSATKVLQQNQKINTQEQSILNSSNKKMSQQQEQNLDNSPIEQKQDYVQFTELKYFPGNKTTINFQEFCEIFGECMNNQEIQSDLLQNCFGSIDYCQEGYIDSKKIQNVFEIFNDKITTDEINNVLKFCGVSSENMSFEDFQEFFQKNL